MAYFDCCLYIYLYAWELSAYILYVSTLCRSLSLRKIFCNRLCYTRILHQIETDYESTLLLFPSPTFPFFMPDCGIAKDEFKRVYETHLDTIWLLHTNTTNLQLTIHLLATEIKTQNTRLKNVLEVAKVQNGNLHCCWYIENFVMLLCTCLQNIIAKRKKTGWTQWQVEIKMK